MLKAFTGALKNSNGAFSFAHLIGLGGAKSKKDLGKPGEQEEGADAEAEEVEEVEGAAAAAAPASAKGKGKKGKSESDDDEMSAGEDDGDDDDEDEAEDEDGEEEAAAETTDGEKGGKKKSANPAPKVEAKKADKGAFKRGRKAERRRVGLILSNPAAANNIGMALKLACNTGMSSAAAIALLEATPPASRGGRLDRQMQAANIPEVKAGGPDELKGDQAIAASWDNAMQQFAPRK